MTLISGRIVDLLADFKIHVGLYASPDYSLARSGHRALIYLYSCFEQDNVIEYPDFM